METHRLTSYEVHIVERWFQEQPSSYLAYRNDLIFRAIMKALRVPEVVNLTTGQFEGIDCTVNQQLTLTLTAKGKAYLAKLPTAYGDDVRQFIRSARARIPGAENTDVLFLTEQGEPLTIRSVHGIFECAASETGICITPHNLRRFVNNS